jgi:FAD/FMN-containing dehydrogenase
MTAVGWSSVFQIAAANAASTLVAPTSFPVGISLHQQAFENWAREIHVDGVWTCAPNTPADVAVLANWAHTNGYTLRPRGAMHGWSMPTGRPCRRRVRPRSRVRPTAR